MDVCTIPGREYDSNIYVVIGKIPTIIDTGTGFFSKAILDTIQKFIPVTKIQQILLTHEHYDHVGGVNDIVKETNSRAKIYAHREIVGKLKDGKSTFAAMLGGTMPKIDVDGPLVENQEVTIGDASFQVLFTPGHSIGSVCFYSAKHEVLFSGDTVFAHGGFGRYDFPGGDFTLLLHSIERLSQLKVRRLYPGHGPIIEKQGGDHVMQSLCSIRSLV